MAANLRVALPLLLGQPAAAAATVAQGRSSVGRARCHRPFFLGSKEPLRSTPALVAPRRLPAMCRLSSGRHTAAMVELGAPLPAITPEALGVAYGACLPRPRQSGEQGAPRPVLVLLQRPLQRYRPRARPRGSSRQAARRRFPTEGQAAQQLANTASARLPTLVLEPRLAKDYQPACQSARQRALEHLRWLAHPPLGKVVPPRLWAKKRRVAPAVAVLEAWEPSPSGRKVARCRQRRPTLR